MKRSLLQSIAVAALGALLFLPGIGGVRLFDWDEINFAESAREMLLTGDWFNVQINFESFWEKPPLFIWMQALSMKVFGVGEFAARFPNAVCGIITLLVLLHAGRRTEDERFGLMWALMYAISFLPFFYFKSGIIDPWFNLFIFLGIYFFSRYADPSASALRMRHAALSAAFNGLAVMTKGPVGFLIFCLTVGVWLIVRRRRFSFRWKDVAVFIAVFALVGGSWFLALALTGHADVIEDFIQYQIRLFQTKDAGHGGFPLYHFIILLIGVTPASIFALSALKPANFRSEGRERTAGLLLWMSVAFWVVLILFSIVRTKIVHYSSFCYFPISFIAAWAALRMMDGSISFRGWQKALLIVFASGFGIVLTGLSLFDSFKDKIIPYVKDPFAVSCMEASSQWTGFEPFVGILLIAATVWFCISFGRTRSAGSFVPLAAGQWIFALTAIICAVPEVEKYSQASAVDFYIERQGEDCYVQPAYFKSYAQYFYTMRQPQNSCDDFDWLCKGKLDKPCYFVLKDEPGNLGRLRDDAPEAELLYRRSGFLFLVRKNVLEGEELDDEQDKQPQVE